MVSSQQHRVTQRVYRTRPSALGHRGAVVMTVTAAVRHDWPVPEVTAERAAALDWADAVIVEDERNPYPERRFVAVGYLDGRLHILCFTPLPDGIRVISFRKANLRESRRYGKEITVTPD